MRTILAILALLFIGFFVWPGWARQTTASSTTTTTTTSTRPAAAPQTAAGTTSDQSLGTKSDERSQGTLTEKAAAAQAGTRPSNPAEFKRLHDARLLDLERRYIVRGSGDIPTDASLLAWMRAAGLNFSGTPVFDARQVEEEQVTTEEGVITVVAGIQLRVQNATVAWPAAFSTDQPVDSTGARFVKPSARNGSVLYTDVTHGYSGTLTFWADAQNWGQLWP